ncbi:MAG: hypothetical protein JO356_00515 [Acidobacteria bacterium]|nr:hypothetical protein [Acidobacteriota bacterium]
MRVIERATPVAAVLAALSSVACCLPFAFIGAAGFLGISARLQGLRPWLLAAAGVLLVVAFFQLYLRRDHCERRSRVSLAIFWIAAAIVLLLILFPQIAASILAG